MYFASVVFCVIAYLFHIYGGIAVNDPVNTPMIFASSIVRTLAMYLYPVSLLLIVFSSGDYIKGILAALALWLLLPLLGALVFKDKINKIR